MGLGTRITKPPRGWVSRNAAVWYAHNMTIGAAGAISSQDAPGVCGCIAAKQGTAGNYLFTFLPSSPATYFRAILYRQASLLGALGATNTGSQLGWLSDNVTGGTRAGTIVQQWYNVSANAAADLPNGTVVTTVFCFDAGL